MFKKLLNANSCKAHWPSGKPCDNDRDRSPKFCRLHRHMEELPCPYLIFSNKHKCVPCSQRVNQSDIIGSISNHSNHVKLTGFTCSGHLQLYGRGPTLDKVNELLDMLNNESKGDQRDYMSLYDTESSTFNTYQSLDIDLDNIAPYGDKGLADWIDQQESESGCQVVTTNGSVCAKPTSSRSSDAQVQFCEDHKHLASCPCPWYIDTSVGEVPCPLPMGVHNQHSRQLDQTGYGQAGQLLTIAKELYHHKYVANNQLRQRIGQLQRDEECSICYDSLSNSETLDCGHSFHAHCLSEHRRHNDRCPICRTIIRQ